MPSTIFGSLDDRWIYAAVAIKETGKNKINIETRKQVIQ